MFLIVAFIVFMPYAAFAADWSIQAEVDEPTGQDDLASIVFSVFRADGSEWVPPIVVPATSPNGGGHTKIVISGFTPDGTKEVGEVQATAVDTSGNASQPASAALLIDKEPPSKPINLTITTTSKEGI